MPKFEKLNLPTEGELITFNKGKPNVPNNPIVPYIRGDGTGVDIWPATQLVLDEAIKKSYGDERKINSIKPISIICVILRTKINTRIWEIFTK